MIQNKQLAAGGLILGGLAAFAWYKYSKMSEEERRNMMNNLKEKGKKLYDEYMPQDMKNMFAKKDNMGSSQFGDTTAYGS